MLITCTKCNSHVDTGDSLPGDIIQCRCGLGIMVPEGPAAAGKMNCPACGAPVDPQHKICEFCDTRLATVMCPTCFGMVFDGAKHCQHCGAGLTPQGVIHHGDETEHACPRCDEHPKLRVEVVAGCPIERCDVCEGLWIEDHVVDKIYKDRDNQPSIQALTAPSKDTVQGTGDGVFKPEGYIKCPTCEKLMNRHNFGRFSGVIIDTCKGHGTWFDSDELRRIIEFIQAGGLEKQAKREREELKEEMRKMRAQARDAARADARAGGGMGSMGRITGGTGAISITGLLKKIL